MSVLAEGFSVIVRRSTIEAKVWGGMESYAKLVPNRTLCADEHLTRVGFLDWPTANDFLERLRAVGLTHHNVDEGPDVGVLHQDEGFLGLVPWLEWHRDQAGLSIAWLSGTPPGELAIPQGWSAKSALRYIDNAEASSRLIPLKTTTDHASFVDSRSGEVVYGLPSAPNAPDLFANMETVQRLTADLRLIRDQVATIYVYYFPKSWSRVIAQSLRLVEQPDFGRYRLELEAFSEVTNRIVEESKKAAEAVMASDLDSDIKESVRLAHQQVFFDGGWVVFFCEYVKAMREGDRQSQNYFRAMADYSHKAHTNLRQSQRAIARLNAKHK